MEHLSSKIRVPDKKIDVDDDNRAAPLKRTVGYDDEEDDEIQEARKSMAKAQLNSAQAGPNI